MIEPKKHIKGLVRVAPPFEDRIGKVYRFDRNERTTPFPQEHLKRICESITPDEMVAYPDLDPLCARLAEWLRVNKNQVLLTAGSDTAIKAVYEVYIDENDEVITLTPTYGMYVVYCRMFGAKAVEIQYDADLSLPVDRIISAITPKTKMIALADPNHTGTVIAQNDLLNILKAAQKSNVLVLLDEAYYHFYDKTMLPYLKDFDNLVIIRTFSKAFGIAPLRVGYFVSSKEIIEQLYKAKLTHEITMFSAKAALYLLDHLEILNDYVQDVREAKEVLYNRLPKMGFEVLKSEANFVFFKTPSAIDGKKLVADLEKNKIVIKGPFNQVPFTGHLRVTVGTGQQMEMFCDAIEQLTGASTAGKK